MQTNTSNTSRTRQGAAANARRAKKNALDVLAEMIESHPTWGRDRLYNQWRDAVESDDGYLCAVMDYTFTNYYERLEKDRNRTPAKTLKEREADKAAVQAKADAIVSKFKEAVLMEHVMPNGKKLGDCSGPECVTAGGFFACIGRQIGRGRTVRQDMREVDLRALYPRFHTQQTKATS